MLNFIIDFAVKNRLLIVLGLLASIVAGMFVLPKLNLDAFPDVTNVQVTINTEAPGLAAEEVEQLITYPVEAVMYTMPSVEEVRSISKVGLSIVTVVFKEGVDIYFARQLVFQELQTAIANIPDGVNAPSIGPNTSGLGQIYQYVLRSNDPEKYDMMTLRSYNDWVVKLLLLPIEGITDVLSFGGDVRQYQVHLNPSQLLAYKLTSNDIVQAIEDNNRNAGGWYLNRGDEQLIIRGVGWIVSGDEGLIDIGNTPVKEENGTVVRVKDVATVSFGSEIRQGAVSMTVRNDDLEPESLGEVVTGIVLKRLGANTKSTIDSIEERIPIIQAALPDGVTFETVYDQSNLVKQAVLTVVKSLIEAFILIFIVLFLCLMNVRATLLVLISVPLSIGMALVIMASWGISANLMSLGGLAIAIGMIVDGSVVMMENIFKHLSKPSHAADSNGHDPYDVAHDEHGIGLRIQEAAREVAKPVFFAVLIIIITFAPIFTLQDVEGKLFRPMAQSIVFAMITSLVVAMVVLPALATYFYKRGFREKESFVLRPINRWYRKTLAKALAFPKFVITTSVSLLVLALFLLPFLGTEFVPELEEGTLNIRATLAPSINLDASLNVAQILEQKIISFPEVTYVSARVGRAELGGDPEPVSNIELLVGLKPINEWTTAKNRQQLQQRIEEQLETYPGLLLSFSQPIATRVDELLSGVKAQLAIKLFGSDLTVLAKTGKEIEEIVKTIPGAQDVAMEAISGEAQLVIKPNREILMRYGLSVGDVMSLVSDQIGGKSAGQIISGNERYDIYVRLAEEYRGNITAIESLLLMAPSGVWVRLADVATIQMQTGPPQIRRDDVQRRVVIQANVRGRDMGSLVTEIKEEIAKNIVLPVGYTVEYGGQFKNQERAQARLMLIIPVSLALIFLLLYFAFSSVSQALLIMVNVPLALIGGVFALFVSGQYLSVPGSVGFIGLFGIAVLNGVVLISAINQHIKGGMEIREGVYEGALSRLRPVLITASIASLGLVPMLLAQGIGSEVQRPLATVVVGGLISSTFLTLFLLPVLYLWFFTPGRKTFLSGTNSKRI